MAARRFDLQCTIMSTTTTTSIYIMPTYSTAVLRQDRCLGLVVCLLFDRCFGLVVCLLFDLLLGV